VDAWIRERDGTRMPRRSANHCWWMTASHSSAACSIPCQLVNHFPFMNLLSHSIANVVVRCSLCHYSGCLLQQRLMLVEHSQLDPLVYFFI
jgi:hypothetical protein